jgi:hypothetical protein
LFTATSEVGDAQERGDERVPPALRQHPEARVEEDDGHVGGRRPGGHVAGVLHVAGRVGEDVLAPLGGEVPVRHVDGDALLALGREAVGEEREIDVVRVPPAAGASPWPSSPRELVVVDRRWRRAAAGR